MVLLIQTVLPVTVESLIPSQLLSNKCHTICFTGISIFLDLMPLHIINPSNILGSTSPVKSSSSDILIDFVGIVGEIGETDDELFIWTHKKFDIGFDGDKVSY